jgi:hypothetical protein
MSDRFSIRSHEVDEHGGQDYDGLASQSITVEDENKKDQAIMSDVTGNYANSNSGVRWDFNTSKQMVVRSSLDSVFNACKLARRNKKCLGGSRNKQSNAFFSFNNPGTNEQRSLADNNKQETEEPSPLSTRSSFTPPVSIPPELLESSKLSSDHKIPHKTNIRLLTELISLNTVATDNMGGFFRRMLSDALLNLRAAQALKDQVYEPECRQESDKLSLREVVGDYGLTLFSPLDKKALSSTSKRSLEEDRKASEAQSDEFGLIEDSDSSETPHFDDDDYFNHEVIPVQIAPEDNPEDLILSPRIMAESMFQQISDEALPRNLRMYEWERAFCISRDGDAFFTMLEMCNTFKHTLIVIKTTTGNILGGFASETWKDQDGFNYRNSFYGTGICFLFSDFPRNSDPDKKLSFYPWTGVNNYCQICDVDRGKIAMGGGEGDFGLIIDDAFQRGSTGRCSTFNNPALVPSIGGSFDILEFEVYGLLPLLPTLSKRHSSKYSIRSLVEER